MYAIRATNNPHPKLIEPSVCNNVMLNQIGIGPANKNLPIPLSSTHILIGNNKRWATEWLYHWPQLDFNGARGQLGLQLNKKPQ